MSRSPLVRSLERVNDERSFVAFLGLLANDRAGAAAVEAESPPPPWGRSALGWENTTIEGFLEAAVAWAADSLEAPMIKVAANPWRRCADILYAGKGYE